MTAAVATLRHELAPERMLDVNDRGDRLRAALDGCAVDRLSLWITGLGSMNEPPRRDDRVLDLLFHHLLGGRDLRRPAGLHGAVDGDHR